MSFVKDLRLDLVLAVTILQQFAVALGQSLQRTQLLHVALDVPIKKKLEKPTKSLLNRVKTERERERDREIEG